MTHTHFRHTYKNNRLYELTRNNQNKRFRISCTRKFILGHNSVRRWPIWAYTLSEGQVKRLRMAIPNRVFLCLISDCMLWNGICAASKLLLEYGDYNKILIKNHEIKNILKIKIKFLKPYVIHD